MTELLKYELDVHRTEEAAPLLRDLTPDVLKLAKIRDDWAGQLAYQRGRVALQRGDCAAALPLFKEASALSFR